MNRKYWIWGTVALVAATGAFWTAASAWRAHRHLVTLHVRNASLVEVIRAIQSQTGDELKLDKGLDTLVTLNVKNRPLTDVLELLTQQIGGDWTTVYAVYDSINALRALESTLSAEANLQEAGWKKIAPGELARPGLNQEIRAGGPGQFEPGMGRAVTETEDVGASEIGTNRFRNDSNTKAKRHNGPAVVRVVRRRGDNGSVEQEVWSPVELLLESRLSSQLTNDFSGASSYEEAQQAAREVNGRVKVYYIVRKSQFGMGLVGMPRMQHRVGHSGPGALSPGTLPGGTNATELRVASPGQDLEEAVRRQRLEEFGRLTPEQRVQRSRERQHFSQP